MAGHIKLDLKDLRFGSFILAIFIYALWGSPTPDDPALAEFIIGALLVIAAGIPRLFRLVDLSVYRHGQRQALWEGAGCLLLLYGLSLCVLRGIASGNDVMAIIRDVLPFMFLLLPLFVSGLIHAKPHYADLFIGSVLFLGVVFSLRVFAPFVMALLLKEGTLSIPDITDPFYLANAPTVLFSTIVLFCSGLWYLFKSVSIMSSLKTVALFMLALPPLLAMVSITQRATIAYFVLAAIFMFAYYAWKYPVRASWPVIVMGIVLICAFPVLHDVYIQLAYKTQLVGVNMRLSEMQAVIDTVSSSPLRLWTGLGWGGGVESTAVGGLFVNFTHSLISSMWLKTGIIGVVLTLLYMTGLFQLWWRLLYSNPMIAIAILGPVAIDVFLYASYKSLDFGLVLLVITVLCPDRSLKAEIRKTRENIGIRPSAHVA